MEYMDLLPPTAPSLVFARETCTPYSNVFFLIQVSGVDWWRSVVGDKVRERRDASVDGLNRIRAYLAKQESG